MHATEKNKATVGVTSKLAEAPSIPSIDLHAFLSGTRQEQEAIATQVDRICRDIGFLVIENHGIAESIVDDAWSVSRDFFDQPLAEKLRSRSDDPTCPRGYFPMAAETLAKSLGVDTPPDIKESIGFGPLQAPPYDIAAGDFEFHYGENLWPAKPAELRKSLTIYFDAMTNLGTQVLQLFAAALALPHDFFARFHTHPMCALRCINYPASDEPLLPGQRGAGAHSDYGSITILKSDPNVQGLEIKLPNGQWAVAPLVRNGFIVNIGDLMARWTNNRWVSTVHRVTLPNTDMGNDRRQSIAFFHNTNFDAEIACIPTCLASGEDPKHEPVVAGRYLFERFTSAVN